MVGLGVLPEDAAHSLVEFTGYHAVRLAESFANVLIRAQVLTIDNRPECRSLR